jgi:hypothetical protein
MVNSAFCDLRTSSSFSPESTRTTIALPHHGIGDLVRLQSFFLSRLLWTGRNDFLEGYGRKMIA